MVAGKSIRLSKLAREFNVGIHTIVEALHKKGFDIDSNPNTKVTAEAVQLLEKEYKVDISLKKESEKISFKSHRPKKEVISIDNPEGKPTEKEEEKEEPVTVAEVKITVEKEEVKKPEPKIEKKPVEEVTLVEEKKTVQVIGKIDLEKVSKPKKEIEKPKKTEEPKKPERSEKSEKEEKPVELVEKKEVVKDEPPKEVKPEVKKKKEKEDKKEPVTTKTVPEKKAEEIIVTNIPKVDEVKVVGKIDLKNINQKTRPAKKSKEEKEKERKERHKQKNANRGGNEQKEKGKKVDVIKAKAGKLDGPTVLGKIDLPAKSSESGESSSRKKRRKRIKKDTGKVNVERKPGDRPRGKFTVNKQGGKKKRQLKKEVNEEDVQKQIKDTLARLTSKGKSNKGAKYRRDKRAAVSEKIQADIEKQIEEQGILKVTEFVSVAEFATMMDVTVTQVISSCMSLGLFVSINQRLDAETLSVVAEEFGFKV
jgi:translation initiation factor IF-2